MWFPEVLHCNTARTSAEFGELPEDAPSGKPPGSGGPRVEGVEAMEPNEDTKLDEGAAT